MFYYSYRLLSLPYPTAHAQFNISKILQLNVPWKVSGNDPPLCNPSADAWRVAHTFGTSAALPQDLSGASPHKHSSLNSTRCLKTVRLSTLRPKWISETVCISIKGWLPNCSRKAWQDYTFNLLCHFQWWRESHGALWGVWAVSSDQWSYLTGRHPHTTLLLVAHKCPPTANMGALLLSWALKSHPWMSRASKPILQASVKLAPWTWASHRCNSHPGTLYDGMCGVHGADT